MTSPFMPEHPGARSATVTAPPLRRHTPVASPGSAHPESGDRIIQAVLLQNIMELRVAELWKARTWWRRNWGAEWPMRRRMQDDELRTLVGLLRTARKDALRVPDPIDEAKGWPNGR